MSAFRWYRCHNCGHEAEYVARVPQCDNVNCEPNNKLYVHSDEDGEWPLTLPYPKMGLVVKEAVGAQAVLIHAMADQLMALRSITFAMLVQASKDELSATDVDGKNPWFAIKEAAKKLMNPKIKELNRLLGIE